MKRALELLRELCLRLRKPNHRNELLSGESFVDQTYWSCPDLKLAAASVPRNYAHCGGNGGGVGVLITQVLRFCVNAGENSTTDDNREVREAVLVYAVGSGCEHRSSVLRART